MATLSAPGMTAASEQQRRFVRVNPPGCRDEFIIDPRYSVLRYIGGGAYGRVVSAIDNGNNGRKVAIKKIGDVFRDLGDAKRILRELKLLRHLGGHENISWIVDIMLPSPISTAPGVPPPMKYTFNDVYIVTDLMDTDLAHIIESPQALSDSHIKYFTYQICRGSSLFICDIHYYHVSIVTPW
jgi:serine/threonine protein kinase